MNRKIGFTLVLSVLMVIGTGCGQKPLSEGDATQVQNTTNSEVVLPIESVTASNPENLSTDVPSDTTKAPGSTVPAVDDHKEPVVSSEDQIAAYTEKIQVYYTDSNAMELLKKEQEISYTEDLEKYQSAFKALQNDNDPAFISLWSKMELKTISNSQGMITLDIHMPDEARLGSGGEVFALEALKNTLFQFEEVKSIELLVDGEAVESLMGHADLEHPMVRN